MPKPLDPPIMHDDFRAAFGHISGQRVLQDLRQGFHYDDAMFELGIDSMTLAFREGQRSVVLWLLNTVEEALETLESVDQETTDGQPTEDYTQWQK